MLRDEGDITVILFVCQGFATWICDRNTAEWKEMPNVDECVSNDVRERLIYLTNITFFFIISNIFSNV